MKNDSIKNSSHLTNNIQAVGEIYRVLWITLFLNLIPTILKLYFGYRNQSLSLIAGGFDSFFDSMTNIIGFIGIRIASKPADKDHPYGHRKAETITALIISYLLFITCYELSNNAIEQIRDPSLISSKVDIWSFIIIIIGLFIQSIVGYYELSVGRKLKSDILIADALHSRGDVFASLSLIIGFFFIYFQIPLADPIITLFIVIVIGRMGIEIIIEAIPTLLDKKKLPLDKVEEIALTVEGVQAVHNIRSRGHEEAIFADLHIQVDPTLNLDESHRIAHEVERRLQAFNKNIQDITVHIETNIQSKLDENVGSISQIIRLIAQNMHLDLVHIRVWEIENNYNLEIHIIHNKVDLLSHAIELNLKLEDHIRKKFSNIQDCIIYIEPIKNDVQNKNQILDISGEIQNLLQKDSKNIKLTTIFDKIKIENINGFSNLYIYLKFPGISMISDISDILIRYEHLIQEILPNHFQILIITELE